MKVVRLSALPLPPGNIPGTHFCQRLSQPQGHSVARRIMLIKNSNDTIGNQTRACSAVPQLTAPPRAPSVHGILTIKKKIHKTPASSSFAYYIHQLVSLI
jgi:hypothetical protein